MLLRRRYLPMDVIRGSFLILNTGPETSFLLSSFAISCSALGTIVRNLQISEAALIQADTLLEKEDRAGRGQLDCDRHANQRVGQ